MSLSGESPAWPEGILDIPIQDDLELDTHSTHGEHSVKEHDSWQQFNFHLEQAGLALPEDIDDPYDYYVQRGHGRFHRAYVPWSSEMLGGMTTRPDDTGGRTIDTLITVADPSLAATAVRRMFERNIMGEFAGLRPLPHTRHVALSEDIAAQNIGIKRAVHDLAITDGERFVIPMPNIVTPQLDRDEEELEKTKAARPDDFTGVLRYVVPGKSNTSVEEFYRDGEFAGKIVIVAPDEFLIEPDVKATDAHGEALDLEVFGDARHRGPLRQIHFLKLAAENNPDLAAMITAA